jgi:hypothetical protein
MLGAPAFHLFASLVGRLNTIHLTADGIAFLAVFCTLLLLTLLEGATLWQTEIDTGTSAAATLSARDTVPPDHRPPKQRAPSRHCARRRVWTLEFHPRQRWQARFSLMRWRLPNLSSRRRSPTHYLIRSLVHSLSLRQDRHSGTFPTPARAVSIASG